jgi:hypothetical protein
MKRQKSFSFLLPIIFMFFISGTLVAQEVSNISFKQEGAQVVISYDIAGNPNDLFNSIAYYSIDEGKTWTQLVTVTGDLLNVGPGSGKKIYWEVLKDVTGIKGAISFKVIAVKSKEKTYDKKGFLIAGEVVGIRAGYIIKKWGINGTYLILFRQAGYLSLTRNIITKEKLKWNAGPFYGRVESFDAEASDYIFGPLYGLTNELQFKKLYFNVDLLYSPWESDQSTIFAGAGFGIVF